MQNEFEQLGRPPTGQQSYRAIDIWPEVVPLVYRMCVAKNDAVSVAFLLKISKFLFPFIYLNWRNSELYQ